MAATSLAVVTGLPLAGPTAVHSRPSQLSQGSSGAAVKEPQTRIAGWAADSAQQTFVSLNGGFGPGTEPGTPR